MQTRKHVHEEEFPVEAHRLYALLHTPSAIRFWWSASRVIVMPEVDGIWAATWGNREDDPDYVTAATIAVFDPPRRMVLNRYRYHARTGPLPFDARFVVEFVVTPNEKGASLRVEQSGFPQAPEADAFYVACERGWEDTFAGIRRYVSAST